MALGTQQHAADKVSRGDAWRSLHHLESVCRLDEPVAILAAAVRRDVVSMDNILAAEVADPIKLRHVRRVRDRPGHPSAGLDRQETFSASVNISKAGMVWNEMGHDDNLPLL